MLRLLILGVPSDYHAHAVAWGVRQKGGMSYTWMPGDLPDFTTATLELDAEPPRTRISVRHSGDEIDLSNFNVVWNRRRQKSIAPGHASPLDTVPIEAACAEHTRNLLSLLGSKGVMINSPVAQFRASRKGAQLAMAARVGLKFPPTIITNDFDEAARFLQRHGRCVGKPYQAFNWIVGKEVHSQFTFPLDILTDDLRASLALSPIIIQKRIARREEVRLVMFGDVAVAARVATSVKGEIVDSRIGMRSNVAEFALVNVPTHIREGCRRFMAEFGTTYGAFDFIIDDLGSWQFLECNEGGQFLFIEKALPEVRLLDKFCDWLTKLAGTAEEGRQSADLSLEAFEASSDFELFLTAPADHKQRSSRDLFIVEGDRRNPTR